MLTYPESFSRYGLRFQPFKTKAEALADGDPPNDSNRRELIDDRTSSFSDFLNNKANGKSITGYKYTRQEMKSGFLVLTLAKIRVEAKWRVHLGLAPAYDPAYNQVMSELPVDKDGTPDFEKFLKPNVDNKKFKKIKREVEAKVADGVDRLRASFETVLTSSSSYVLTDSQWSELTGVEYVPDEEPVETEEAEPELIRVVIDATGEEFDALFADGQFITVEDEPQVLNPEEISLIEE